MADPDPRNAAAARARAGLASKRKRATEALSDDENDSRRVSGCTVKKLNSALDSVRARADALVDRTNTLETQRNTKQQTIRRLRKSSQEILAAKEAEHAAVLATHQQRIQELESRLSASESTVSSLRAELKAFEQRLKYQITERDRFCARKVDKAVRQATTFNLKPSGVYSDPVRALMAELVAVGRVGTAHVDFVIRAVAECAGITVLPAPGADTRRTVRRAVNEGSMGAKLHVAKKLNAANGEDVYLKHQLLILTFAVTGICLSGDGTTHGHRNIMGRHVTVTAGGAAETLCLGVTRPVDHTTETTFQEWLDEFKDIELIFNECHADSEMSEAEEFAYFTLWEHIHATATDHAADQVAFADRVQEHRMEVGFAARGIRAMQDMRPVEFQALMCDEKSRMVCAAGGVEAWLRLSTAQHQELEREMLHSLQVRLGKAEFAKLSPSEQAFVRFFIRSGCCMHKDLNAVVYGNKRMMASWAEAGLPGPMKLYNRDNSRAADSGSSEAQARADEVTQAGGVKLAFLFGLLFNGPDNKMGYSGLYRASRFQSNYEMARFILHYRQASIDFLRDQQLGKTKRDLNHLEQNVWDALHDGPTLSELAALAFYGTAIGRPYMHEVRRSGLVNMTDLGPMHLRVIELCEFLSQCPELLYADAEPDGKIPGSLFGDPFDDPMLFTVLDDLQRRGLLPQLEVPVKAFFAGAADGWRQFSKEFLPGGSIASATEDQLATTIVPATNDHSESLVGGWKAEKKYAPSMGIEHQRKKAAIGAAAQERKEKKALDLEARLDVVAQTRFLSLGAMLDCEASKHILKKVLVDNVLWHRKRGQPTQPGA
ncbi:hypothetical protein AURDEDRAFT_122735 [Auricularia subglabra TFB-10046 SS5]|nr:hypothetical protein AURDEDRAFT_122735 [Auricularia subglabra TFB-10046 SS5]